jgi:hypothetical protein
VFAEEPATLKPGMLEELAQGQPLQLWRVTIRERPFYLIGVGTPTDMPEEVQGAFDRIFARPPKRVAN